MSSDSQRMREIERDEAWLGEFASPSPSEGTVVRVKAEARLAVHEGWLAAMDGPAPSPAVKAKVRGAIRDELSRGAVCEPVEVVVQMRSSGWHRTVGALSAAALVSISVGIARFSPGPETVEPVVPVAVGDSTLLAEVDEAIEEIRYELSALESGSTWSESWEGHEDDDEPLESIYEALESLMNDIVGGPET